MSDLTCAMVEQAGTEYALGILPASERQAVSDHLEVCPACRAEIGQIRAIGDQLLDLVPDVEPPLGFDRKVLSALHPGRSRWRPSRALAIAGCAAAAAVIVAAVTLTANHARPDTGKLTALLRQGNRTVGSVYVDGSPPWVTMTVRDTGLTGTVICQLVTPSGTSVTVGDFEVVNGRGTWSAPDPATGSQPVAARLIAPDGSVLATATFGGG